jgi:hypothetical protein
MESELRQILIDKLQQLEPQLGTTKSYGKWVNKYVDTMLIAIHKAMFANMNKLRLNTSEFSFPKHKVFLAMGRYGNPQDYIYTLMQKRTETSLLLQVSDGFCYPNNSQLTVMRFNPIYEELLMQELQDLKLDRNEELMDDLEQTYTHIVDVDVASLRGYINKTKQSIAENKKGMHYNEALLRNLTAAKQLMVMVHEADERNPHSAYLLERYETADCGRSYGKGLSLQCMRKKVREAALGVCHQYDFKACAFAVMAGLAHAIDKSLKIGGVLDYVRMRTKIRERIAKEVNVDIKLVKSVITAIGFGAKLRNNFKSAIRKELMLYAQNAHDKNIWLEKEDWSKLGEDEYKRLLANQTFIGIYNEFQLINSTIINYFDDDGFEINGFVYSKIDPHAKRLDKYGKRKKASDFRTNAQKLAWIYQAFETQARQQFEQLSGQKALLTTHDCIYFKQKLPVSLKHDILYQLQQTFKYLTFEHTPIYQITDQQTFDSRFAEQIEFEREHRERIKEQEVIAANTDLPNNWCETYLKPQDVKTEYEYETKRREQFLRDVGFAVTKIGDTTIVSDEHNVDDEDDNYWEPSTERQYWRDAVVD